SLLQIDTINVVARSPYLVLFSRLGLYSEQWLDEALRNGDIFEYWAHEACFIPKEDYRLVRPQMMAPENMGWKYSPEWHQKHQDDINKLLTQIRHNGPVKATDFSAKNKKTSGWWEWKPEKRHLETLFSCGQLMVKERVNFHRVYDLPERVIPEWNDDVHGISPALAQQQMLANSARSLGAFKAQWLADYYRLKKIDIKETINNLLDSQEIIAVRELETQEYYYIHHSLAHLLAKAQNNEIKATHTTLLSPFDPVVWDRRRASELFGFDYRLECYTPEAKRTFGYFSLPILQRGALVGRIDAKMHRKEKVLELKSLHQEKGVRFTEKKRAELKAAITLFATWQQATEVKIQHQPDDWRHYWGDGWMLDGVLQQG
ncbi:MAG: winged helix DNA-binding domain-containing protein, partial [Enterobacterales bacterium]|nr:winged helix DNA-binding domain-containing protein [Enterobacterales bacterium]